MASGGLKKQGAEGLKKQAEDAASALEAVEAKLRLLDRLDAFAGLEKKVQKAIDPMGKMVAQQRLAMAVEKDYATQKLAAANKAVSAENKVKDAAKAALAEKIKGFKESRLGGAIEEAFGKKASTAFARWRAGAERGADEVKLWKTGLGALGGVAGAVAEASAQAAAALASVTTGGASFALEMLKFRQNTEFAMKYALGSGKAAKDTFALTTKIANNLGVGVQDIAPQVQAMFRAGLGASESEQLVHVFEDIKAASGGAVDPKPLLDAVMSIKKGATLNPQMFAPLREVNAKKTNDFLAGALNIKGKEGVMRTRQIDAAIAKITDPRKRMELLSRTMLASMGEQKAGEASQDKMTSTVDGALGALKSKVGSAFMAIEGGSAGKAIIRLALKFSSLFDPASQSGQKLQRTLTLISVAIGDVLGDFDFGDAVSAFNMLLDGVTAVLGPIRAFGKGFLEGFGEAGKTVMELVGMLSSGKGPSMGFAEAMKMIGVVAGYVVVGIGTVLGAVVYLEAKLAGMAVAVGGSAVAIGVAIIDGMTDGLDSAKSKLLDRLSALAELLPDSVRKLLGIGSPSRVFMQLGRFTAQGMALGLDQGAPQVRAAVGELVSPPAPPAAPVPMLPPPSAPAGPRGGARPSISLGGITIHVDATGQKDPQAVAKQVGDEVERRLQQLLEQLAMQFGVAGPQES